MRKPLACLLAASIASGVATGRAETCPTPPDAPLVAASSTDERLAFLGRAFDREVSDIDLWSWTWGGGYAALAIGQGIAAPLVHDTGTRTDLIVGSAAAGFGALSLTVLPLKLTLPLRAARRRWDDPDRCATLARAERTLVDVAKDQAFATGVFAHLGNVAVNVGIALILGWGYGRWTSGVIAGVAGVAVGEVNAFTQPAHLGKVLEAYRSGHLPPPVAATSWTVVPVVDARGGLGARVVMRF